MAPLKQLLVGSKDRDEDNFLVLAVMDGVCDSAIEPDCVDVQGLL